MKIHSRLELTGISKSFTGTPILRNINLRIDRSTVHALIGDNGSGKSTLAKIIFGALKPDSGHMSIDSRSYTPQNPTDARRSMVSMIFQSPQLCPSLSAVENLVLSTSGGKPDQQSIRQVETLAARFGIGIDLRQAVGSLSLRHRQCVDFLRCMWLNPRLLILDEPISAQSLTEATVILQALRKYVDDGGAALLFSHKLKWIRGFADTCSILSGGEILPTGTDISPRVNLPSVGLQGSLEKHPHEDQTGRTDQVRPSPAGEPVCAPRLSIRLPVPYRQDAECPGYLNIMSGEIVGVSGAPDNSWVELENFFCEARNTFEHNRFLIDGNCLTRSDIVRRRQAGLAVIPEVNLGKAFVPGLPIWKNMFVTMGPKSFLCPRGWLLRSKARRLAGELITQAGIQCSGTSAMIDTLSGGNLRKLAIDRELARSPSAVIAIQPFAGLDKTAVQNVRASLRTHATNGAAMIIFSNDPDDFFRLCDRVHWLRQAEPNAPGIDTTVSDTTTRAPASINIVENRSFPVS